MAVAMITGATGFLGRYLIARLRAEGTLRIVGTGLEAAPPPDLILDDYIEMDVCDSAKVHEVIAATRPDLVFHLAGISKCSSEQVYRTNFMGSIHLLDAIRSHAPASRTLLVGSAAEYGQVPVDKLPVTEECVCRPIGAYGESKYAMTLAGLTYAIGHKMKVVIVRPFNILGPGIPPNLFVGAIIRRAKEALSSPSPPEVRVGNTRTERDFSAATDVADACFRALHAECWGEVFNVCSGRPTSIRSVLDSLLSHSPRPITLVVDPSLLRESEPQIIYGSPSKAMRGFGFHPVAKLDDTLQAAWEQGIGGTV